VDHNVSAAAPPAPQQDLRVLRTRRQLRGALLSLLGEKPFDRITVREITARAGTGYATFFRHYAERWALLNDLITDEIRELLNLAVPILRENGTRDSALALCRYVDEHNQLWSALLAGGSASTLRDEYMRQVKDMPRVTSNSSWLPHDLKMLYGMAALFEVLAWWLHKRREYSIDQAAEILDRLVIVPLMKAD
jgi:AcrR family transcriptional regulator